VLARLDRFEIDPAIRATTAAYPAPQCAHWMRYTWATAQVAVSATPLTALVTYYIRLSDTADALGATIVAPGKAS
jgi:hypothetical protein